MVIFAAKISPEETWRNYTGNRLRDSKISSQISPRVTKNKTFSNKIFHFWHLNQNTGISPLKMIYLETGFQCHFCYSTVTCTRPRLDAAFLSITVGTKWQSNVCLLYFSDFDFINLEQNHREFSEFQDNTLTGIQSKIDYNLISDTLFENESLQIHKLLKNHHRLHHHHNLRHQLGHLGRKRGGILEVIHKLSNKKMYFRLNLSFLNLFGGTECNKYPKWHEFEARRFTDRGSARTNIPLTCW